MSTKSLSGFAILLSGLVAAGAILESLPADAFAQQQPDTNALGSLEELLNTEVTSSMKYDRKIADIPASVGIITSDDIERYGFRTPLEAIATLCGFYVSYDRNYTYIGARGFSRPSDYNNRIKVLINGHTINENYYNSANLDNVLPMSMDAIERIEVTRGPGSALYGTGAMFAVINIVTKNLSSLDGAIVRGGIGQFGELSMSGVLSRTLSPGTDLTLSGSWADVKGRNLHFSEFNTLATNYGVSEGEDWERYQGFLGTLTHGGLHIQGMYTNRRKGIPTGAWGTVFDSRNSRTLDRFAHGEIGYDAVLWTSAIASMRTTYDHYYYIGHYPYVDVMNLDANWGNALGCELRLIWDPRPNNRVIAGVTRQQNTEARYKYWDAPEPVYYDKDTPYSVTSVYLQDEYQILPNASVVLGLRHDRSSRAPGSTTPRAGVVYHPTSTTTLKGLYGQAFRTPSIYELFWDNSDIGFRGNPVLKPEQIQTTEVVVEQRLGRYLQADVSAFKYHMHNLIDFVVDPVDSVQVYQNAGAVSTRGIEVGIQARLPHEIAAFANYSFQDAHDLQDEDISNSPYHLASAGVSLLLRRDLSFAAVAHAESNRRTVYGTQTASFATVDFNVTFAPQRGHKSALGRSRARTSLQIRVTNAFDAAYATPGGYEHSMDAIAQDGRKVSAVLKVEL